MLSILNHCNYNVLRCLFHFIHIVVFAYIMILKEADKLTAALSVSLESYTQISEGNLSVQTCFFKISLQASEEPQICVSSDN